MGQGQSEPTATAPTDFVGLQNFGNTCYCNSVLQALYYCAPFRERVLESGLGEESTSGSLLAHLAELFKGIDLKKKRSSLTLLRKFISKLRRENELFNNREQHDAHEFLNYLINTVDDLMRQQTKDAPEACAAQDKRTWVDDVFKGTLTNETKCLCCETVRTRDEDFIDLSVDIEQNASITRSLKGFSCSELLCNESKYYCEECCSKQEATKSLRVKVLPQILVLHLKRFKYMEHVGRFVKLSYRVAFPFELKLFNTSDSAVDPDRMYDLTAVIIHCGGSAQQGHYITLVKHRGYWIIFDDDLVEPVEPHTIEEFFGIPEGHKSAPSECGYILFYQTRLQETPSPQPQETDTA